MEPPPVMTTYSLVARSSPVRQQADPGRVPTYADFPRVPAKDNQVRAEDVAVERQVLEGFDEELLALGGFIFI